MRFDLTEQEQKIYKLLATTELTVKEIAKKLCISESTAATHKRNVFQKFYFTRRTELIRHYYSIGVKEMTKTLEDKQKDLQIYLNSFENLRKKLNEWHAQNEGYKTNE